MKRIAQVLLICFAGVLLTGVSLLVYLYWVSGPEIQISSTPDSPGVEVDTRFLGEYHLGLTTLVVSAESGEILADLRSEGAQIPNVFRLAPGINQLEAFSQQGATETLAPFALEPGRTYSIEVCGNDGSGSIRCSSARFTL